MRTTKARRFKAVADERLTPAQRRQGFWPVSEEERQAGKMRRPFSGSCFFVAIDGRVDDPGNTGRLFLHLLKEDFIALAVSGSFLAGDSGQLFFGSGLCFFWLVPFGRGTGPSFRGGRRNGFDCERLDRPAHWAGDGLFVQIIKPRTAFAVLAGALGAAQGAHLFAADAGRHDASP
jgi:hypothetical protein